MSRREKEKTRSVLGIAVGENALHLVEVAAAGRLPQVRVRCEAPRPEDPARIPVVLNQILRAQGIEATDAAVAVPTDRAFLRELTFESRERGVRRDAVGRLNVSEENLVFNYVVQGKNRDGQRAVLMVAIPRDVIETHRELFRASGLNVLLMAVAPLGFLAAHRLDETVPQRSLVLAVHGSPGRMADLMLLDGGGLRWAEASDIRVPVSDEGNAGAEFWWEVVQWVQERGEILAEFCGDMPVGRNLLISGPPRPDSETQQMLADYLGTAHVFYPGDGIDPQSRVAYGVALMELGFAVPADVSFHPTFAAVRKTWIQNAVLTAGALGFAYSAFLANLAVGQKRIGAIESAAADLEGRVRVLSAKTERYRRMGVLLGAFPELPAGAAPLESIRPVVENLPQGVSIRSIEIGRDGSFELTLVGMGARRLERKIRESIPELDIQHVASAPSEGKAPVAIFEGRWKQGESS